MSLFKSFFSDEQLKQVEAAIHSAEKNTSGEIRVHIEDRCKAEPLKCAAEIFHKLGMDKTDLRNGVLIFVALKDRQFVVVGDEGINKHVPPGFWDQLRDKTLEKFKEGKFPEGLCEGIDMAGHELKKYFPGNTSDKNELSNQVTSGDQ